MYIYNVTSKYFYWTVFRRSLTALDIKTEYYIFNELNIVFIVERFKFMRIWNRQHAVIRIISAKIRVFLIFINFISYINLISYIFFHPTELIPGQ